MDQPPSSAAAALVRHFDAAVQEAFARFQVNRSPDDASLVVVAIVWDHAPSKEVATGTEEDDWLSLTQDLNFDSVTIAEMVFFIEDLFGIRISNAEIMGIRTIGELRHFVREKLAASASPSA